MAYYGAENILATSSKFNIYVNKKLKGPRYAKFYVQSNLVIMKSAGIRNHLPISAISLYLDYRKKKDDHGHIASSPLEKVVQRSLNMSRECGLRIAVFRAVKMRTEILTELPRNICSVSTAAIAAAEVTNLWALPASLKLLMEVVSIVVASIALRATSSFVKSSVATRSSAKAKQGRREQKQCPCGLD